MSDLQQKQRDYLNTPEGLDEVLRHFGACGVTRPGKSGMDEAHTYWRDIIDALNVLRHFKGKWKLDSDYADEALRLRLTLEAMTDDYARTVLGVQDE